MTIAVTGHKGRLGSQLIAQGLTPLDCDITSRESIRQALEQVQPEIVINAAAWTDVDGAESEESSVLDQVMAVNTKGPGYLRTEFDGYLIHVSTGFVFDGKSGPYEENDPAAPVNWYGWSKLGGEAAAQMKQPVLIVRTLDLYGPGTNTDFVRQIRDLLELGQTYALPSNLYGSPTYIPHLVDGIMVAVDKAIYGILHITGDTVLSRFKWGRMIAEHFGYDPELIGSTDEILGVAPRPLRGGLSVEKAIGLGIPIYSPEAGLTSLAEATDEP